jgi:hypothetical protein
MTQTGDVRIAAWHNAMLLTQTARQALTEHGDAAQDMYDNLLTEATVWATLARAEKSVGVGVFAHLQEIEQTQEKAKERKSAFAEAIAKARETKKFEDVPMFDAHGEPCV